MKDLSYIFPRRSIIHILDLSQLFENVSSKGSILFSFGSLDYQIFSSTWLSKSQKCLLCTGCFPIPGCIALHTWMASYASRNIVCQPVDNCHVWDLDDHVEEKHVIEVSKKTHRIVTLSVWRLSATTCVGRMVCINSQNPDIAFPISADLPQEFLAVT